MEKVSTVPEVKQDDYLNAETHCVKCGCGKLYIIINTNGDFHSIAFKGSMAKESPCGEAWLNAMSGILTFALRRAIKEDEDALYRGVVRQLKNQACNNHTVVGKSCVHQISVVLEDYLKKRAGDEKQKS